MALVTYAVCDGCGAAQPGTEHPPFWPAYTLDDAVEPSRFCTDECARMALAGDRTVHDIRLERLGLTRADAAMLQLLGAARTNSHIRLVAGLSESTVRNNLSSLFRKLGAKSRAEAVLIGHALAVINLNVLATQFLQQTQARHRPPNSVPSPTR